MKYDTFKDLENMKILPELQIPDYSELNRKFIEVVNDPAYKIRRENPENGHPVFGAYTESNSNELVTWGILAIGQWLMNKETDWIAPAYFDFFSKEHQIFLNVPKGSGSEYWYLFYVNLLAGAIKKTLYADDERAAECMKRSVASMRKMAESVNYDFNDQGYRFNEGKPFTNKDIYRQPDSVAGYAYQLLYAAKVLGEEDCLKESLTMIQKYEAFAENPWYEIPNGSAGLYTAAWLDAHGYKNDVKKAAGWVFDHDAGPMQKGFWGEECVNGLMMGWRGDTRKDALDSAYSMETLMPLQFLLPTVKYYPKLAEAVSNWTRHVLSSFQLFYGEGRTKLEETKPGEYTAIPYERLQRLEGRENPTACGDFAGHRSVYGAGYLMWLETLVRRTDDEWILALDLSITDWLSDKVCPVYLLQNPYDKEMTVSFSVADIWKKKRPDLLEKAKVWDLDTRENLYTFTQTITVTLKPKEIKRIAIDCEAPEKNGTFLYGSRGEELTAVFE